MLSQKLVWRVWCGFHHSGPLFLSHCRLFSPLPVRAGPGCDFLLLFSAALAAFSSLSLSFCFSLFGRLLYFFFSLSLSASGVKWTGAKTTALVILFILLPFILCSPLTPHHWLHLFLDSIVKPSQRKKLGWAQEVHVSAVCCSYIEATRHKHSA